MLRLQHTLHSSHHHCYILPPVWLLLGHTVLHCIFCHCDCWLCCLLLLGSRGSIGKLTFLSKYMKLSIIIMYWLGFYGWTMQPEIPFLPVFASMKRLARYNLGSVALGSLIVSFVESVRFILEAIRRRTKVSGTTPDHWFWRMAHYTSRGCLKSVEWTIKSVNRNAYIMVTENILFLAKQSPFLWTISW